jgi:hypothetical protein
LFSDAGMELDRKIGKINPRYNFKQCLQHREYVDHLLKYFEINNNYIYKFERSYNNTIGFRTGTSKILLPYYERWYPNDKKVVPHDFKVTPTILLHAYLGDGWLLHDKTCKDTWFPIICTNSFDIENLNNNFINQLHNLGMETGIRWKHYKPVKKEPQVYIRKCSFDRFFEYIGPPLLQCFKHKWLY